MTLGGVLLAVLGIILVVLVANGRWPNVWNAALGGATTAVNNAGTPSAVVTNTSNGYLGSNTYTAGGGAT